jgi:hypothetical protein
MPLDNSTKSFSRNTAIYENARRHPPPSYLHMKHLVLSIVLFCALPFSSVNAQGKETPHLQFVSTYIQQLGTIEKIRDRAAADLKVNSGANSLPDCIRNMTSYQLELTAQIAALETMHLNPPFENVVENFTDFYKQKLTIYKQFTDVCSALIAGLKPNVDYGALAAEAPKLNARLDFNRPGPVQVISSGVRNAD